jgi:general stress protein YciG
MYGAALCIFPSHMRFMTMANKESGKSGSQGGTKNPGNFANDRQKASEAGRKGGQQSGTTTDRSESGRKGGRS